MKPRAGVLGLIALAALSIRCSAATRHAALVTFFDGVPPKGAKQAESRTTDEVAARPARSRGAGQSEHGPYAAQMCGACHESGFSNALVVPKNELCLHCHALRLEKAYIHGPIASGGCLVCHDPHSSRNRFLLVSASDGYCFHCHSKDDVARVPGHDVTKNTCTDCHDAHMSDRKYLLK